MHTQESTMVKNMFASIAERYDLANSVLSLGIHHIWKRDFIRRIPLPRGIRALDLACGTGDLVPLLAGKFGDRITGGDFCEPMLAVARRRFGGRFSFEQCDALDLPFEDDTFDLVTVSFGVRNFENLGKGLREMRRVLKPRGIAAVLEFGQPDGKLFGPVYRAYSKYLMPVIGGMMTGNRDAYSYLPETAARFPAGAQFVGELSAAGFTNCSFTPYTFGTAYGYQGQK